MRKSFYTIIITVFILSLLVLPTACSDEPTPAPAAPAPAAPVPTSAPAAPVPTSAPAAPAPTQTTAPAEPINLKWSMSSPPILTPAPQWAWLGEELEKRTQGRITITFYYMNSLVRAGEEIGAVTSGLSDIAGTAFAPYSKVWPLVTINDLPSIQFPTTAQGLISYVSAIQTLYEENPQIQEYFKDFKVLQLEGTSEYYLHTKKAVRVPDDVKGMKVGTSGSRGDLITSIGGATVPVFLPDQYMALKTGQIDASITGWSGLKSMKLYEAVDFHLDKVTLGRTSMMTFMNQDSWNKLSPADQELFTGLVKEAYAQVADSFIKQAQAGLDVVKENNQTIIEPTAEEQALWREASLKIEEKWVDKMKNAGAIEPEKILARFKQLAEEAGK